MGLPDKGQANAQAAYAAAKGGTFTMPIDSAKRLAAACDRFVEQINQHLKDASQLTHVTGFPALPSGDALAKGFSAKGQELNDTLVAFKASALELKAAYLAAGNQLTEADQAHRAAIAITSAYLEGNA